MNYISHAVAEGAASTRTPADIIAARITHSNCPFCGDEPVIAQRGAWHLVGCISDDCAINPQAGDKALQAAWKKWDARSQDNTPADHEIAGIPGALK